MKNTLVMLHTYHIELTCVFDQARERKRGGEREILNNCAVYLVSSSSEDDRRTRQFVGAYQG